MKKLLPLFLMLAVAACDNDKNQPVPYPDPAVLAKQQAPFGTSAVDVKLKKIHFNGRLFAEYIYEGDLLREQKKYLMFNVPGHYQSGSFVRNGDVTESYDVTSAEWVAESQYVSDVFKPSYSIKFIKPNSDSIRNVTEENLLFLEIFYRTYAIDKDGFITRQEFTEGSNKANDFKITYTRNGDHNVSETRLTYAAQPEITSRVTYVYDNHPNPFFKIGIDRNGQLGIQSLSPNNIVKETVIDPSGSSYVVDYTYEYAANGYPSKVKIDSEHPYFTAYTLDYSY